MVFEELGQVWSAIVTLRELPDEKARNTTFLLVLLQLQSEDVLVEVVLQLLVGQVDAELLGQHDVM